MHYASAQTFLFVSGGFVVIGVRPSEGTYRSIHSGACPSVLVVKPTKAPTGQFRDSSPSSLSTLKCCRVLGIRNTFAIATPQSNIFRIASPSRR